MDLRAGRRRDEAFAADVARLNGLLGVGISFELISVDVVVGDATGEQRRGRASPAAPRVASGILILGEGGTVRRVASRPVALSRRRRDRFLALASCLAECAMDLGLGIGVYGHAAR